MKTKTVTKKTKASAYDSKGYKATKHTGLRIYKDDNKFLFDVMIDGKRYRKTYKSKAPAHDVKDKIKVALSALDNFVEQKKKEIGSTVDFNATVDDYYKYLKASNSWNTKTAATYDGIYEKYISETLGKKKITDVVAPDFTRLNATIKHLAKGSQKKLYDILIPSFNLAVEDDIIIKSPIKRAHVPKRDQLSEKKVIINATNKYKIIYKTLYQLFNSTDIVVISETKQIQCSLNPHHLALFLFGFHGRRITETVKLKWDDIDFVNNQYVIRGENSKINTDMIFTLPADIRHALEQFADVTGDVFSIKHPKKYYFHIRDISGIEEYSYHWMRNLAVSALAGKVDATELSAMLGHTDTATLRKYLSLQRDTATRLTSDASAKLLS